MSSTPACHAIPLLLGLNSDEPGKTWIFRSDIRLFDFLGDDLNHLVARIALAAGELVRGLRGSSERTRPRMRFR